MRMPLATESWKQSASPIWIVNRISATTGLLTIQTFS
jgi:hypothetical protein